MKRDRRELLHPTKSLREMYEEQELAGRGAYGDVWVCEDRRDRREYACKVIDKEEVCTDGRRELLDREIQILIQLAGQHQDIIQVHRVYENTTRVQLVMELCRGGDLFDAIKARGKLPEASAKLLFRQLASAVECCHSHGVMHRDIKPDNILFVSSPASLWDAQSDSASSEALGDVRVKLADFGLAVCVPRGELATGFVGTRHYSAPEMVHGCMYGLRADVWSLGVVLYVMLTGTLPVLSREGRYVDSFWQGVLKGRIDWEQVSWGTASASAQDLVKSMLCVDLRKRLHASEVLAHPWLDGQNRENHQLGSRLSEVKETEVAFQETDESQRLGGKWARPSMSWLQELGLTLLRRKYY